MRLRTDWKLCPLNELGFVGRGRSRHRPRNDNQLYGGPYPFIQTADIMDADPYIMDYSQTYSEFGFKQSKMWPPETLCITIAGANTAKTAILKFEACFPDSIVGFIPEEDKADLYFVKYSLDLMKDQFLAVTRGATQDNLSLEKLLRFPISTPPISIQRKIADVLSQYDESIANNNQRIKILEQMAQRIYKEWFVDFRFPGHENVQFVNSKIGKIPNGWKLGSFLEAEGIDFISGNIPEYQESKRYFATADVNGIDFISKGIDYQCQDKPSRAQKQPVLNSVWFARMKDTYKVLVFTNQNAALTNSIILSSGFAGLKATVEDWISFLFVSIKSKEFHHMKDMYCTGATQMALTNDGLGRMEWLFPTFEVAQKYNRLIKPMIDLILDYQQKNKLLRSTRDILFPKFIAGEIDASELNIVSREQVNVA